VITWKVIAQNTNTNTRASVTNTASKSSAGTKPLLSVIRLPRHRHRHI